MAARRLRVGLVGAGLVGQTQHAFFLWDDRDRFELAALADPSAQVRASLAARYGVPETRERADELFDLGLDAIVCAAPDAYHHEVTVGALRAGLHVLCEKPLALSVEDCDDIAQLSAERGLVVQVGTMKRYDPSFVRLLELLPGSVEDVAYITAEVNDPDQAPFVAHLPLVPGCRRARAAAAARTASASRLPSTRRSGARRAPARSAPSSATSRRCSTT